MKPEQSGTTTKSFNPLVLLLSGLYIAFLAFAYYQENILLTMAAAAVPLGLGVIYLAITRFETLAWLLVFSLPLSINFLDIGFGIGISVPGEGLVAILALTFVILLLLKKTVPLRIMSHPVTILIGLQLTWFGITTITSSNPLVSIKFLLIRVAFMVVFYLLFSILAKNPRQIFKFMWLFLLGMVPVMLYSIIRHAGKGFSKEWSFNRPYPFFMDHTIYAAVLAMILPFFIIMVLRSRHFEFLRGRRFLLISLSLLLVFAVISAYSRATWLSLAIAFAGLVFFRFRFKFRVLLGILLIGGIFGSMNIQDYYQKMASQRHETSRNILDHAQSVTNLRNDDSNLERLNRWSCAVRMFVDRPFFGFGPGTYEFAYGNYQLSSEKTIISTLSGDMGDAHSEYLISLSETGLPGLILFILLILVVIRSGMRLMYYGPTMQVRLIALGLMLGLITYYIHGGVNSFLDTDKTAALFWGMTGMLVALEVNFLVPMETLRKRDSSLGNWFRTGRSPLQQGPESMQ